MAKSGCRMYKAGVQGAGLALERWQSVHGRARHPDLPPHTPRQIITQSSGERQYAQGKRKSPPTDMERSPNEMTSPRTFSLS